MELDFAGRVSGKLLRVHSGRRLISQMAATRGIQCIVVRAGSADAHMMMCLLDGPNKGTWINMFYIIFALPALNPEFYGSCETPGLSRLGVALFCDLFSTHSYRP